MRTPKGVLGGRRKALGRFFSLLAVIGILAGVMPLGAFAEPGGNGGNTNHPGYWEDQYSDHQAVCYKYDKSEDGAAFWEHSHGKVTQDGKAVRLKSYQSSWPGDHWEVLIVKGGPADAVYEHPQANQDYYAPLNPNNGKNYDVSHWIVCKGTTPKKIATTPTWTVKDENQRCDERTGQWVGQQDGKITLHDGTGYTWATSTVKSNLSAGEYGPYQADANTGWEFEGGSTTFSTGKITVGKKFLGDETECLKKVHPKAPKIEQTEGCDIGYFKIKSTQGVDYYVNGELRAPGIYHETGTFTVTAQAKPGYKLSDPDWSVTFTIDGPDGCLDNPSVVSGDVRLVCNPTTGEFEVSGMGFITLSSGANYTWDTAELDMQGLAAGTYGPFTATAADGYAFAGGKTWSTGVIEITEVKDQPECDKQVETVAPAVTQSTSCGIEGFVLVPDTEGVDYFLVDGDTETLVNGQKLAGPGTFHIVAKARPGFELVGETEWTIEVELADGCVATPDIVVTPELLVCNPITGEFEGQANGAITLVAGANFSWEQASMTGLTAGIYGPFAAKADPGFVFEKDGTDTFVVDSVEVTSQQQTEDCAKLPVKFACDVETEEVVEVNPGDPGYDEAFDTRSEAEKQVECDDTEVLPTVVTTTPGEVDDDELPFTGTDAGLMMGLAALLLAVGATLLAMSRRPGEDS